MCSHFLNEGTDHRPCNPVSVLPPSSSSGCEWSTEDLIICSGFLGKLAKPGLLFFLASISPVLWAVVPLQIEMLYRHWGHDRPLRPLTTVQAQITDLFRLDNCLDSVCLDPVHIPFSSSLRISPLGLIIPPWLAERLNLSLSSIFAHLVSPQTIQVYSELSPRRIEIFSPWQFCLVSVSLTALK